MKNYRKIFDLEKPKINKAKYLYLLKSKLFEIIPNVLISRSVLSVMLERNDKEYRAQERRVQEANAKQEYLNIRKTHEIKQHLDRLHLNQGENIDPKEKLMEYIRNLRKLMRKL